MIKQGVIIIVDSFSLACLWAGLYVGVQGALNVGLFMAWLTFVCSFVLLSKEHADDVMKEKREWQIWRSGLFDVVAILMLIWHGWWMTGAAVLWGMMLTTGAWMSFKNREAEAV